MAPQIYLDNLLVDLRQAPAALQVQLLVAKTIALLRKQRLVDAVAHVKVAGDPIVISAMPVAHALAINHAVFTEIV